MSFNLIVVSFHTNRIYQEFGARLRKSCDAHNLPHYIVKRLDQGNWVSNCKEKPKFLLECARKFPEQDLLWIDCDGVIRKAPVRFMTSPPFDVAVRMEGPIIHGGTMYFKNRPIVHLLLNKWIEENERLPGMDDRPGFMKAAASMHGVFFQPLPVSYDCCPRFDSEDAVISQDMISRLLDQESEKLLGEEP